MREIELSAGTLEYEDSGGDGPVLVLLHGLMMDVSLWDGPIGDVSADHRCVAPTLPLGAHRHAMRASADLSLPGIARLVAEFLDRLDLHDVTLVGNDTGGALVQLLICERAGRVARVVLASCDAFDNFPPGLTGRALVLTGKLPPAIFGLFMQQMRIRAVRRLPIAFGWLTKRGDAATARWMKPVMERPEIRRDTVRTLRAAAADTHLLIDAAECLPRFQHPALIVWASGDRVMPPEHGRRLAGLLPHGQLAQIDDSYTLIPLDQPTMLAQAIREFIQHNLAPHPARRSDARRPSSPRITRRTAEQQPAGLGATEVQVRGMLPGEADAAIWPAEIAVTIVDDWQGRGLGTALLTRLSGRVRCEGIHRFTALVAEDNTAMAGLLRNMSARSRRHCRAQGPDRRHRHTPGRLAKIPPLWAPSGDARGKRRLVPSSQNIPSPDQR